MKLIRKQVAMRRAVAAVCCTLFVAQSWGLTTSVNRCTHSGGQPPLNAHVHGCTNPPCVLPLLQDLIVDVTFAAPRKISQISTHLTASRNFGAVQFYFPLDLGEAARTCDFLTLPSVCPIQNGELIQYRFRWRIEQYFVENMLANIEMRTVDDSNNSVIWCFRLPVQIQEPLPTICNLM